MKVNKYFLAAHKHLWAQVEDILWFFQDYTVTFHGHSLGGALASLAAVGAVEAKILKSAQVRHYTFGQPRVGNLAFAQHFDELIPHRSDFILDFFNRQKFYFKLLHSLYLFLFFLQFSSGQWPRPNCPLAIVRYGRDGLISSQHGSLV
jgi:fermentation-respiration switch protein FrsA (DUF1100 family)